jgi:hypothetical protein
VLAAATPPPQRAAASADAPPAAAAPPAPAAPAAPLPAAPQAPRFHYRAPVDGTIVRAYALSVFAGWMASGELSAAQAASLLVWRRGAAEDTAVPLSTLLPPP